MSALEENFLFFEQTFSKNKFQILSRSDQKFQMKFFRLSSCIFVLFTIAKYIYVYMKHYTLFNIVY